MELSAFVIEISNDAYTNIWLDLTYIVLFFCFSKHFFGTNCKTFCPKWIRLPNKVWKEKKYKNQSKSDLLFNTQSRVLYADWLYWKTVSRQLNTLTCFISIIRLREDSLPWLCPWILYSCQIHEYWIFLLWRLSSPTTLQGNK